MTIRIPFWQPMLTGRELPLLQEVLEKNYLNEGDLAERFEQGLARQLGVKHAVAMTSCTAALFASLKALDIGPGDEVLVPDLTFIATANSVSLAGATPVLVDADPETLTLDRSALKRALTGKSKAIIPVHVSGRGGTLSDTLHFANEKGLAVVEDAAEAHLSKYQGAYLGTFGQCGCVSFSPNKTMTTGQGGAVFTDDDDLARRLHEIKDQGRARRGTGGQDQHPVLGYNFKFTNLQAAVGLTQIEDLPKRTERLRALYKRYREDLAGIPELRLLPFAIESGETPQWIDALVEDRDELDAHLLKIGIQCRRFWFPLHSQKPYAAPAKKFPNATRLSTQALWLPSALTITDAQIDEVCTSIREFYARKKAAK